MTTVTLGPPCHKCLHQIAETFQHHPWICESYPDGVPGPIYVEGVKCPHFKESKSTVAIDAYEAANKAAKAEPKKADGGLVKGKKLIRFQLPPKPTAKDVEKLSKWVKEQ